MDSESANPALVDDAGMVVSNPTPPTDTANILEMCLVTAGGKVADAGDNSYRNHVRPRRRLWDCPLSPVPSPHRQLGLPEHHTETEAEDETSSPSAALPQPGTPVNRLTEPHHLSSREYYRAGVVAGCFLLPSKSPPASLLTQITPPNSAPLLETTRPVRVATRRNYLDGPTHVTMFCHSAPLTPPLLIHI